MKYKHISKSGAKKVGCPKEWWDIYGLGNRGPDSEAAKRGRIVHSIGQRMAEEFQFGLAPEEATRAEIQDLVVKEKLTELDVQMGIIIKCAKNLHKFFSTLPKEAEILNIEQTIIKEIGEEKNALIIPDLIVKIDNDIIIYDYKTGANIPKEDTWKESYEHMFLALAAAQYIESDLEEIFVAPLPIQWTHRPAFERQVEAKELTDVFVPTIFSTCAFIELLEEYEEMRFPKPGSRCKWCGLKDTCLEAYREPKLEKISVDELSETAIGMYALADKAKELLKEKSEELGTPVVGPISSDNEFWGWFPTESYKVQNPARLLGLLRAQGKPVSQYVTFSKANCVKLIEDGFGSHIDIKQSSNFGKKKGTAKNLEQRKLIDPKSQKLELERVKVFVEDKPAEVAKEEIDQEFSVPLVKEIPEVDVPAVVCETCSKPVTRDDWFKVNEDKFQDGADLSKARARICDCAKKAGTAAKWFKEIHMLAEESVYSGIDQYCQKVFGVEKPENVTRGAIRKAKAGTLEANRQEGN